MNPAVSDRERWIALGLLGAALLLGYALLVHPWWTVPMREANARIAQLQQRDARLRAELAQAPLVQKRLQDAQQRLTTRPGFLAEATTELAVAGLVQRLETVVAQASPGNRSCQISNRSPLPGEGNEPYTRVAVQVRLRCGTPELAAVLHALEAGTPRLFVENLNILAQRFFFAGGGDAGGRDGGLDVSFDLVGYLRPAGAAVDGVMPAPAAMDAQPIAAPPVPAAQPTPTGPMPADASATGPVPATGVIETPSGASEPAAAPPGAIEVPGPQTEPVTSVPEPPGAPHAP